MQAMNGCAAAAAAAAAAAEATAARGTSIMFCRVNIACRASGSILTPERMT